MAANKAQLRTFKRVVIYEQSPLFPISSLRCAIRLRSVSSLFKRNMNHGHSDVTNGCFSPSWRKMCTVLLAVSFCVVINSKYSKGIAVIRETYYGWLVACYIFGTQNESCRLSVYGSSACRMNPGWRNLVTVSSFFHCSEHFVSPSHCAYDRALVQQFHMDWQFCCNSVPIPPTFLL
jgi:hypothetical protein